jgi:hypothetical protein
VKSYFQKLVVVGGILASALTGASAQVLYDANGWEATGTPAWMLGIISDQNSWLSSGGDEGHQVVGTTVLNNLTITPLTGTRMHRTFPSPSNETSIGRWQWINLIDPYTERTAGNNTVIVSLDAFMPSSETASQHEHGIDAYDDSAAIRLAAFTLQSQSPGVPGFKRTVSLFRNQTDGFGAIEVFTHDTWTHFDLVMDLDAGKGELFVEGIQLAVLDDVGAILNQVTIPTGAQFGDADLYTRNDPATPGGFSMFSDNYRVEAVRSVAFNGQVALEDLGVGDALSPVNVIFVLQDANGNPVNAAYFKTLVPDTEGDPALGNYSVRMHDVADGTYKLFIKGFRHLSRVVDVTVAGGTVTVPLVTLRAGDANGDDAVDVFDLDVLVQAFNTTEGDETYNAGADFNYDNAVDVFDLSILITNFNEIGEGA